MKLYKNTSLHTIFIEPGNEMYGHYLCLRCLYVHLEYGCLFGEKNEISQAHVALVGRRNSAMISIHGPPNMRKQWAFFTCLCMLTMTVDNATRENA